MLSAKIRNDEFFDNLAATSCGRRDDMHDFRDGAQNYGSDCSNP
jgi:hypothetical protein